jgi:hypothetical protein
MIGLMTNELFWVLEPAIFMQLLFDNFKCSDKITFVLTSDCFSHRLV